jgi:hypothetical protein
MSNATVKWRQFVEYVTEGSNATVRWQVMMARGPTQGHAEQCAEQHAATLEQRGGQLLDHHLANRDASISNDESLPKSDLSALAVKWPESLPKSDLSALATSRSSLGEVGGGKAGAFLGSGENETRRGGAAKQKQDMELQPYVEETREAPETQADDDAVVVCVCVCVCGREGTREVRRRRSSSSSRNAVYSCLRMGRSE